jgi:hypothetical protein
VLCKDLGIYVFELPRFTLLAEDVPVVSRAMEVLMRPSQNEIELERAKERVREARDGFSHFETIRLRLEAIKESKQTDQEFEQLLIEVRQKATEAKQKLTEAKQKLTEAQPQVIEAFDKGLEKGELVGSIRLLQQLQGRPQTPRQDLLQLSLEALQQMLDTLTPPREGGTDTNGAPSGEGA